MAATNDRGELGKGALRGMGMPAIFSIGIHLVIGAAALFVGFQEAEAPESEPIEFMVVSLDPAGLGGPGGEAAEAQAAPADPQPAPAPAPKRAAPKPRATPPSEGLAVATLPAEPEPEEARAKAEAEAEAEADEVELDEATEAPTFADASAETEPSEAPVDSQVLLALLGGGGTGSGIGLGVGVGHGVGTARGFGFSGGSDEPVEARLARTPPKRLGQPEVRYPMSARSRGIEGVVRVRMIVDREGRIETESTQVVASIPALDAAAIRAANGMRFSPGLDQAGRPIRVIVEIPIHFRLN